MVTKNKPTLKSLFARYRKSSLKALAMRISIMASPMFNRIPRTKYARTLKKKESKYCLSMLKFSIYISSLSN